MKRKQMVNEIVNVVDENFDSYKEWTLAVIKDYLNSLIFSDEDIAYEHRRIVNKEE